VNIAGIKAVVFGVGHRNEERENTKDENDESDDKQSFHIVSFATQLNSRFLDWGQSFASE
jgi:hypothetical protein